MQSCKPEVNVPRRRLGVPRGEGLLAQGETDARQKAVRGDANGGGWRTGVAEAMTEAFPAADGTAPTALACDRDRSQSITADLPAGALAAVEATPDITDEDIEIKEDADGFPGDAGAFFGSSQGAGADGELLSGQCGEVEPLKHGSSPVLPSAAEVEEHRTSGHVQYRSWCRECAMGRGLGEQRGRHDGRPHSIPVIGVDYWYITETGIQRRGELGYKDDADGEAKLLGSRRDGTIVKCILVRDYLSKNVFGHVVPCKGVDEDNFVVKLIVADIEWLGHTRVILKTDQERALVALLGKVMTTMRYTIEDLEGVSKEHSA